MARWRQGGRLAVMALGVAAILLGLPAGSKVHAMPLAHGGYVAADMLLVVARGGVEHTDPLALVTSAPSLSQPVALGNGSTVRRASAVPRVSRMMAGRRLSMRGEPIRVGRVKYQRLDYRRAFKRPWFEKNATVHGFGVMQWDEDAAGLRIAGCEQGARVLTICYHFTSRFMMKYPLTEIQGEITGPESDTVELSFSRDGCAFNHTVRACGRQRGNPFHLTTNANGRHNGGDLWVRIRLELSADSQVTLTSFRAVCRVKPDERIAAVLPPGGGAGVARN